MEYPFKGEWISIKDAIKFVALVVYPDDSPRDSKKRVRARIRYAQEKSQLTMGEKFEADKFFGWAVGKWTELLQVQGLPRSPTVLKVNSISVGSSISSPSIITTPTDRRSLEVAYVTSERERQQLASKVKEMSAQLEACMSELQNFKDSDAMMREKKSIAGKKGGRGHQS